MFLYILTDTELQFPGHKKWSEFNKKIKVCKDIKQIPKPHNKLYLVV